MEKKYIHYCWFGDKPLPKLAKKCIKSWKKYLPDYEIIRWSEENVDLEECSFIKEAYENKKWAFVADYARTKAIYEYGGIYFDTDMEVIKNIDELLNTGNGFLGVEDSHMIACGVWYEPKKHSYLATEMLKFYRSQKSFDINNLFSISIPKIISSILTDYDATLNETQKLKHNETIYKRDYFYPYSYDFQNNIFTDDTCMIHYYDASWVPKAEQREVKIYRILGKQNGRRFISLCRFAHRALRKIARFLLYPLILYKRRKNIINSVYLEQIETTIREINTNKSEYIVFHNPNWLGVTSATTELFDNRVECGELLRKKDIKLIGNAILNSDVTTLEDALNLPVSEGTVSELIIAKTSKIGEKLSLRRIEVVTKTDSQNFGTYLHMGGKIAVLTVLEGANSEVAKDVAMQAAAMKPEFLKEEDIDAERIERERKVFTEQAINEGKPADIAEKMVEGRLKKFFKEICLLDEPFIKDGDIDVKTYVKNAGGEVLKMVRYEVGEGMEHRSDNFAEEVMNQIK